MILMQLCLLSPISDDFLINNLSKRFAVQCKVTGKPFCEIDIPGID